MNMYIHVHVSENLFYQMHRKYLVWHFLRDNVMLFKIEQFFLHFETNLNCFQLKLDVNISFAEIHRNIYQLTMLSHGNWDEVSKICSCGCFNSVFLLFFQFQFKTVIKYLLTDRSFISQRFKPKKELWCRVFINLNKWLK